MDAEPDAGRFLAWPDVRDMAGLSRTTAWRLMRRGEFPSPYRLSPGRVAYSEVELEAWKRWRVALRMRRDGAAARSAEVLAFQAPVPRKADPQGPTPPDSATAARHRCTGKTSAPAPSRPPERIEAKPTETDRADLFSAKPPRVDPGHPATTAHVSVSAPTRLALPPALDVADAMGASTAAPACLRPTGEVISLARRRTRARPVHPDQMGFGF